jgi:methylenetetrahydrofolate dehydrogenase (NADP+)/methenyltetrahydrofolate cyclohydrolase/formyltetrahydrofolate synthetase
LLARHTFDAAGVPLPAVYKNENLELLLAGCDSNLRKQIENARRFGVQVVVAVNRFTTDTDAELAMVVERAQAYGAIKGKACAGRAYTGHVAVVAEHFAKGGRGAVDLAQAVVEMCSRENNFRLVTPIR